MTGDDLRIPLDADTADALDRPVGTAWAAEALAAALRAPEAAPGGGYVADDSDAADDRPIAPVRPTADAPAAPVPHGQEQAAPGVAVLEAPASVVGAPAEAAGGDMGGPPGHSPRPGPQAQEVSIHVVNYYARPGATLSDLPNEWAGNRARP